MNGPIEMLETLFALLAMFLFVGLPKVGEWLESERDPVENLKRDYEEGRITLAEFDDRVELHLDDRAQETRERFEHIDGIGPETSATIARRFRSLDELRDASPEEIEDIHGVGPSTSKAIKESVGLSESSTGA